MDAFTGMISMFGFNYAPRDWGFCAGQFIGINQYPALYALIGTFYGGNGTTTMAMPDFRARSPVGSTVMGISPTVPNGFYPLGSFAGFTEAPLTHSQLPAHNHLATFTPFGGGGGSAVNVNIAVSTTDGNTGTATNGALLSQGKVGFDAAHIFQTDTTVGTVNLGGVTATGGGGGITGGSVAIANSGASQSVSRIQPVQAVTFSIMLDGLFPSRN